jgi:ribosomal-protein-alanine N-acetyltransferase
VPDDIAGLTGNMATPTLETDRLVLRPVTLADAPAIQKYFDNWNIIKRMQVRVPWPYPKNGAEEFLRGTVLPGVESGDCLYWAILAKDGPDEAIGMIEFRFQDNSGGNRGFWLAEPFWGRGYMTEAVSAVQDYLFFDLGIERFVVTNARTNQASRRVKQKTGARLLGPATLQHHQGGLDAEKWEVTRERWATLRGREPP